MADRPTFVRSGLSFVKYSFIHISCFQPLFNEFTAWNSSNGSKQVLVRDVVIGSFDIRIYDPFPPGVRPSSLINFLDSVMSSSSPSHPLSVSLQTTPPPLL